MLDTCAVSPLAGPAGDSTSPESHTTSMPQTVHLSQPAAISRRNASKPGQCTAVKGGNALRQHYSACHVMSPGRPWENITDGMYRCSSLPASASAHSSITVLATVCQFNSKSYFCKALQSSGFHATRVRRPLSELQRPQKLT